MTDAARAWFVSDTHFAHANVIKHSARPFKSIDEMDEALVANWNAHVKTGDDVFHLGDFAWRNAWAYREQLKGNIHLIRGNHESAAEKIKDRFIWVKDVYELKLRERLGEGVPTSNQTDITSSQWLFLSHYAHLVWPRSHHGVWHLYGHSHGSLFENSNRFAMDVGVDATARRLAGIKVGGKIDFEWEEMIGSKLDPADYRPISFAEVKNVMSRREFVPIDHHQSGVG